MQIVRRPEPRARVCVAQALAPVKTHRFRFNAIRNRIARCREARDARLANSFARVFIFPVITLESFAGEAKSMRERVARGQGKKRGGGDGEGERSGYRRKFRFGGEGARVSARRVDDEIHRERRKRGESVADTGKQMQKRATGNMEADAAARVRHPPPHRPVPLVAQPQIFAFQSAVRGNNKGK